MNSFFSKYLGDMFRGNTRTYSIVPLNPNTGEFFLVADDSSALMIFTAKKDRNDPDSKAIFQKTSGLGLEVDSAGNVLVELVPEDTSALRGMLTLYCDLQYQDNTIGVITIWSGLLLVDVPVTRSLTSSVPIYTTNPPVPGGGTGGPAIWGDITGTLSDQLDLQAALDAKADAVNSSPVDALSKITPYKTKLPKLIQHKVPVAGETLDIATFTGVGEVGLIWITTGASASTFAWDAILQVFVDGALLPDIECDLGTLFLNHLDGHAGEARANTTEHMLTSTMGDSGTGMSGGLRFPIPYSNGIRIAIYAPPGGTYRNDDYSLFTQVINKPNKTSPLRLRSNAVSYLNKKTYTKDDIITFFNLTNAAGWLVWLSMAVKGLASGGNTYDYLERVWFFGVDGEPTVPDGNGVISTDYSNSGGEDLFWFGWYFANTTRIANTPFTMVTATNNGNKTTTAGFDFLNAIGGLKFNTALKPGWSLKPGNVINNGHEMSWCFLYYIDTTVPFAPSAPSITADAGDAQVTLNITRPVSYGSSKITGYTGTYSPGSGTFTAAADATTKVITGLTNGTAYTFSLRAVNAVGSSSPATANATPSAAPTNPFPTITSATLVARYSAQSITGLNDGDLINPWIPLVGSINLIETFVTSGPVYKVAAMNGKPVARFTSSTFRRLIAASSFNLAAPTVEIVVWKPTVLVSNQVFDTNPGSAGHGRSAGGINSSGLWNTYAGASDAVSGVSPTIANHVLTMCQNGGGSYVSIDGVKGSTIDSGSGGFDIPQVGATAALDGDMAEFIVIHGNLSDSDRHLIEVWAGVEYNIPIT